MAQYRIVTDMYCGYEVQVRYWWFPFWRQLANCNSHSSVEKAEDWAKRLPGQEIKRWGHMISHGEPK